MTKEQRLTIAADVMCALLRNNRPQAATKKHLVDIAITYTDMLARRLDEIPPDAQQRCERGMAQN